MSAPSHTSSSPAPGESGDLVASEARRALAIGLVSTTTIVLQVALTRILSVVVWYHWAFLAVSLALLGIAAPGVWFSLSKPRTRWLSYLLLLAGASVPLAVAVIVRSPAWVGAPGAPWLCAVAALGAFLTLGGSVCLLLLSVPGLRVGRIYGADLVGAGLGAGATMPLLWLGPTPVVAAMLGALPLVAHGLLWPRRLVAPAMLGLALVSSLWLPGAYAVHNTKTYAEAGPGRVPLLERWSPTVRVTVFDDAFWAAPGQGFVWGPGRIRPGRHGHEQYWLEQDGSAGTPIPRRSTDRAELDYLFDDVTSVAYQLRELDQVAVIGAGGGRDVLAALAADARHVDAIELHGIILAMVRDHFGDFTGQLYDDPRVTPIVGEGRHVLSQSDTRYDLIQISLIDSWSATAAGAYTLAENHLYTVEAYRLFWSRLTERGLLTTSRWMRGNFGLEVPRLLLLVREALAREGLESPERHVAVLQGSAVGTVLVSRPPFTAADLTKIGRVAAARGFTVHLPRAAATTPDDRLAQLFAAGPDAFADQGVDLSPPTDDRPFFFQSLSPFSRVSRTVAQSFGVNNEGVWTLKLVLFIVTAVTLGLLLLPFLFTDRFQRQGLWRGSAYFACIGLGFMLLEVTWMQKLVLLLGHPSRAATVALGGLLLGSGVGSLLAARFGLERLRRWGWITAASVAIVTLVARHPLALLSWPAALQVLVAVLVLAASGLTMGPWFALGLGRFGDDNKPWFWAVNGAASVIAGVGALAVAMQLGYTVVALVGATFYAAAWLLAQGPALGSR